MNSRFDSSHRPGGIPAGPLAGSIVDANSHRALQLWLRWNAAYESAAASLSNGQQDHRTIEAMMDQMDALRQQAIALSTEALSVKQAA